MNTLSTALRWHNLGIATIPIKPRAKQPLIAWKRYQTELPSVDDLKRWYTNTQNNIAVVCGWQDLVILDFDNPFAYFDFLRDHPEFENTYTVQTSRGAHVYVFCEDSKTRMSDDLDIKSNGYCLCPPSVHPSGTEYKVIADKPIIRVAAARLAPSIEVYPTMNLTINGSNNTLSVNVCHTHTRESNVSASTIKSCYSITRLFQVAQSFSDGKAMGHCPGKAHVNGDRNPSLSLDLISNRVNCFKQNCEYHSQKGFSNIDIYMMHHNVSFYDAICMMANELGL